LGREQLESHLLRQPTLVQPELRTNHDHGTARVVHPLAEEVLPKPTLFSLQHVGERLERPFVRPGNGLAAAAVVEQRVHCFLEHALLVADDDLGRDQLLQPLEAVVAVDHPAIEIVQV
jgi:hypothetical protein